VDFASLKNAGLVKILPLDAIPPYTAPPPF
jgi:hypothetical protein